MYINCSSTNENLDQRELLLKILKKCQETDIVGISYEEPDDKRRGYSNLKISIKKEIFNISLKKILG